jgi:hypothetical protein
LRIVAVSRWQESGRHDAHNGGNHSGNVERLTEHSGILVEAAFPKGIADDDRLRLILSLARQKGAAQKRIDAHHAKETGGDKLRACLFGFAIAGQRRGLRKAGQRDVLEYVALFFPIDNFGDWRRHPGIRPALLGLPNHHQPVGLLVRQRPVQDRVHDAEDGAVGADSQCEREHNYRDEAGAFAQRARGIAQVLPE